MPHMIKITSVKPQGIEWIGKLYPEENKRYWDWVRTFPGVLSTGSHPINENTSEITIVFESKLAYDTWVVERTQNQDFVFRANLQVENNISISIEEIEL